MRWSDKKHLSQDDLRKRSGFLLFPKKLFNSQTEEFEYRWLEHSVWLERFIGYGDFGREYWTGHEWYE